MMVSSHIPPSFSESHSKDGAQNRSVTLKTQSSVSSYINLARSMLGKSHAFRACGDSTLDLILQHSRVALFDDGETLTRRNQPIESLLFVVTGSVEIGSSTQGGKRFVTSYMGPGQLQGVIPIIDG